MATQAATFARPTTPSSAGVLLPAFTLWWREIVRFYREVAPQSQKLVIHCEAGVSRSAAVGAALAHCLRQPDEQFHSRSHPNHRVRRLVIEAWREQ